MFDGQFQWASLGIPGGQALVLSDLQGLNASFIGFTDALIAAAPVSAYIPLTRVDSDRFRRLI